MKIVLCVLFAFFAALAFSLPLAKPQLSQDALFRQFYPMEEYHPLDRRFSNLLEERVLPMGKRNNAEVVNGILKHFGTLDRLGDVGK